MIQVILAGWNNFRAVVAGFEVIKIDPLPAASDVSPDEDPLAPDNVITENEHSTSQNLTI